jgi:hypothetical protein
MLALAAAIHRGDDACGVYRQEHNGSSMSQHFSNPARARDPHALPDLETFNVEPGDNKPLEPGWYWRPCLLGGHGEPAGPFETEAEALADATQEDVVTEAAGNNAGSD